MYVHLCACSCDVCACMYVWGAVCIKTLKKKVIYALLVYILNTVVHIINTAVDIINTALDI